MQREVLEFEEEAWKTSAKGGESSTVKLAGEESFGEHDPAGAVIINDVPAFLIALAALKSWRNQIQRR